MTNERKDSSILGRARRMHLRVGLILAPILLLVLFTGICLNHTDELELAHIRLPVTLARIAYGADPATILVSYEVNGVPIVQAGDRIEMGESDFGICSTPLKGAVRAGTEVWLLCGDELRMHDSGGRLLERIDIAAEVPFTAERIGVDGENGRVCLGDGAGDVVSFAAEQFEWQAMEGSALKIAWSLPRTTSGDVLEGAADPVVPREVNLERFLLDLHSGRIFGRAGVLALDAIALVTCLLLMSGIVMWWVRR